MKVFKVNFLALCIQVLLSGTVKNLSGSQWAMEPVFFILTVCILKFPYVLYEHGVFFLAVIIVCEIPPPNPRVFILLTLRFTLSQKPWSAWVPEAQHSAALANCEARVWSSGENETHCPACPSPVLPLGSPPLDSFSED